MFLDTIAGRATPPRPLLIDLKVAQNVMKAVTTGLLGRQWVDYELLSFPALADMKPGKLLARDQEAAAWDNFIAFYYYLGYDVCRVELGMHFPRRAKAAPDRTMPGGQRNWAGLSQGMIWDWESFEQYPWPKVEEVDFFPLEYISSHLPDGMGILISHAAGVFEHVSEILSFEKMCYLLYDEPDLVRAVCDRVGELMESFYRQVVDFPRLMAVFPGDDMGFRTGTLISPQTLRELFLPWHARFARLAHEHRLLFFLHSCGNIYSLMDDLIEKAQIDAKHSFEDAVLPIEEFLRRYGDRVAGLGGLDVNCLSSSTPDGVRAYVRDKIKCCAPYRRYAAGTGSSVTSYIPVANYLTMLEAILEPC